MVSDEYKMAGSIIHVLNVFSLLSISLVVIMCFFFLKAYFQQLASNHHLR